jgi:two-component system, chemotaxis family, sensor kinase Cph1
MVPLDVRPAIVALEFAEVIDVAAAAISPRLLIVEDSFLVIMGLEQMCEDLGWKILGPATRLDTALAMARTEEFDVAMLDVNLAGEMSWPVARALRERGIPFLFSTGYNEMSTLPPDLAGAPLLNKPYRSDDLERILRRLLAERAEPLGAAAA